MPNKTAIQAKKKSTAGLRKPQRLASRRQSVQVDPAGALARVQAATVSDLSARDILMLQSAAGNRAVQGMLGAMLGQHDAPSPSRIAAPIQSSTSEQAIQLKTPDEDEELQEYNAKGKAENRTGLPDQLKSGIESLSGFSMDDVKVHYNSSKPAALQALAYTQGSDIHIGPDEEENLPHEAWHVVQQKQGRVRARLQAKGAAINDDQQLEKEADVMGARAAATSAHSIKDRASLKTNATAANFGGEVAQLAKAAVDPQNGPITLEASDSGSGIVFMRNKGQHAGDEVRDTVGVTKLLDEAGWADLANSPRNYHRAHGYSEAFGGAGDKTNVAWWGSDKESTWTADEEKVRGGGMAQDASWKPGDTEEGQYKVTRTLFGTTALSAKYLPGLNAAAAWGLNDSRAAWTRALAALNTPQDDRTEGERQKAALAGKVDSFMKAFLKDLAFEQVDKSLISEMKMEYTITTAGSGAGGSRANHTKTIAADAVDAGDFGLKDEPENIWKEMVKANKGVFAKKALSKFGIRVRRSVQGQPALVLTPQADGWGVPS